MEQANKFVWAYMIKTGKFTDGEWNFYGGNWKDKSPRDSYTKRNKDYEIFKSKVKTIGIDWDKTKPPISSEQSSFTDTFHDPEKVETLLGTLVLNNGEHYTIGANDVETRFSDYAKMISSFAEDMKMIKEILGE